MFKKLRASVCVALGCVAVCTLIALGDCYLMSMPHLQKAWQSLASIATLALGLPALVIGIQMAAISIEIVRTYRKSDDLLLRAGLDPTDFQAPTSVRPPRSPK